MPTKSRAAREQPSLDPSPSINAPVAGSMAWAAQLHAVMQQHAWAAAVQTPGGVAGQFLCIRLSWLLCVRSRQALLVVDLLLLLLVVEAVPMKPSPLEPLSTKGTRAW